MMTESVESFLTRGSFLNKVSVLLVVTSLLELDRPEEEDNVHVVGVVFCS